MGINGNWKQIGKPLMIMLWVMMNEERMNEETQKLGVFAERKWREDTNINNVVL